MPLAALKLAATTAVPVGLGIIFRITLWNTVSPLEPGALVKVMFLSIIASCITVLLGFHTAGAVTVTTISTVLVIEFTT